MCCTHTKKATYKNPQCLAVLLARIYSASSCRWRGVKKQANLCHAECHFDSNALGGHKKNAHSRRRALMTAAAALCFACYTNVPPTFPFCSNAKLSSLPTLLVWLFSHFFFLPSACTLFTLQLTKKKEGRRERMCTDCRVGPAAAQQERQMQNPLSLMQLTLKKKKKIQRKKKEATFWQTATQLNRQTNEYEILVGKLESGGFCRILITGLQTLNKNLDR